MVLDNLLKFLHINNVIDHVPILQYRKIFREIINALHKYIHFHVEEKGVIKDINHHLDVLWNEYRYVNMYNMYYVGVIAIIIAINTYVRM